MSSSWSDDEWLVARALARHGESVEAIAAKVNRTPKAVQRRFQKRGAARLLPRSRPIERTSAMFDHLPEHLDRAIIPDAVRADRDRRADLRPISLTAFCFGDPLPGRSALDNRGSSSCI